MTTSGVVRILIFEISNEKKFRLANESKSSDVRQRHQTYRSRYGNRPVDESMTSSVLQLEALFPEDSEVHEEEHDGGVAEKGK